MRIAFLNRVTRPFNGETPLKEPLGGTQSAMIYLGRELAKIGHEVAIFCNCGERSGTYDGVQYLPVTQLVRFAKAQPLDFFISVADEQALQLGISAHHTLWWSHNDYSMVWHEMPDLRAQISAVLATRADRLITLSNWHTQVLANVFKIPSEHFYTTRNGVHWPYYQNEPQPALPPRLLYTSVPDRGLDILLAIFPAIRATIPEVELHLYSSFQVWGKSSQWDQQMAGHLYEQAQQMEGVYLHEPLSHPELAQVLQAGTLWIYPLHDSPQTNGWAETSCIAALEAQAAGLPVISSHRGALPEAIEQGVTGILIEGDPYSRVYQQAFIQATVDILEDESQRTKMARAARQRIQQQFCWPTIALEWHEFLSDFQSTRMESPPLSSPFPSPQISVIIPTYNRAQNLKNTLESLTWQTFKAFEVLVCDDGSSDETQAVTEAFRDRLNIRYLYQEDRGFRAAEARNMGLKIARGKLIVFLDSDLVIPSAFLETHLKAHQQYKNIAVNSYVYRMTKPVSTDLGMPPEEYIARHADVLKGDSRDRYQLFERGEPVAETYFMDSNAFSIHMEDIRKLGGFDSEFVGWGHEDTELGYRMPALGIRLLLIKTGAAAYHQYHVFSETQEEERAENWGRLTTKHGITKWYHPLWELEVEAPAYIIESGLYASTMPLMESSFTLKTGERVTQNPAFVAIEVQDGILKRIERI